MKIVNDFAFLFATFFNTNHYRSRCWSRWENLDHFQYQFQPIKFVNLVVPSRCETSHTHTLLNLFFLFAVLFKGGGFDSYQAFEGSLSRVNVWNFIIPSAKIKQMSRGCGLWSGNAVSWYNFKNNIFGFTDHYTFIMFTRRWLLDSSTVTSSLKERKWTLFNKSGGIGKTMSKVLWSSYDGGGRGGGGGFSVNHWVGVYRWDAEIFTLY